MTISSIVETVLSHLYDKLDAGDDELQALVKRELDAISANTYLVQHIEAEFASLIDDELRRALDRVAERIVQDSGLQNFVARAVRKVLSRVD